MKAKVTDHLGHIRLYHDVEVPHGTVSGRLYWGCNCPECREAVRVYRRNKLEAKKEHEAQLNG
jgi:hypothetical protein